MKPTKIGLAIITFTIVAVTTSLAEDTPRWDGQYSWNNTGRESDYGNVNQSVSLSVKSADGTIDIGITIRWHAGATIELGANLKVSDVISQTDTQGNQMYVLPFVFQDPFRNRGVGKIVTNGQTATVSLDATDVVDARASRQYGDYFLTRIVSP